MNYDKIYELDETRKRIFIEGKWLDLGTTNPFEYVVSFLVLDFNKAQETFQCLESIRRLTQFKNYEIVLLSNGGEQENIFQFYKSGLIDRLFLYKRNYGCGIGTHDLYNISKAEYSIYVQNDQYMRRQFSSEELQAMINNLNEEYKCIDLSGGAGHSDKFSERAHIMNTEFYKQLHLKGYGGPGPFEHEWLWSEGGTSYSFWDKDYKIHHEWPCLFANNGWRTIREDKIGKISEQRLF